ncbi:hypothetical protein HN865_02675, partial [Candidatus Woesearchaeota archaeon]|nr:hypothetical protein [Candidatus Woesearchaeota archaeon]MBT7237740.1 hypothetical protein [Candidatus Woesearchaeota archaeon]
MKKLVLLFLFVFIVSFVNAAPYVDSIGSSLVDGSSINITGSSFGVKSPVEPAFWDTLDNQVAYSALSDGAEIPVGVGYPWDAYYQKDYTGRMYYYDAEDHSGHPFYRAYGESAFEAHRPADDTGSQEGFFISWYFRTSADTNNLDQSNKMLRVWARNSYGPYINRDSVCYNSSLCNAKCTPDNVGRLSWTTMHLTSTLWNVNGCGAACDVRHLRSAGGGGTVLSGDWSGRQNTWHHLSLSIDNHGIEVCDPSATVDDGRGYFSAQTDGIVEHEEVIASIDPYNYVAALGFDGASGTNYDAELFDVSEVYFDHSLARIVIADALNYDPNGNAAEVVYEMQIPHTTWNDSNIQFTANQGALNSDQTYYLFVIDENGDVSNGVPVSFGVPTTELTVYGVSGEVSNGGSINISGANFGNGPNFLVFDDFENGNVNGPMSASLAQAGQWSSVSGTPTYTSVSSASGNLAFRADESDTSDNHYIEKVLSNTPKEIFASWWIYLPAGDYYPGEDHAEGTNWKQTWVLGDSSTINDDLVIPGYYGNQGARWAGNEECIVDRYFGSWNFHKGEWYRLSAFIDADSVNGELYLSDVTNAGIEILDHQENIQVLCQADSDFERIRFNAWGRTSSNSHPMFDDIYVAQGPNAKARIEIGNAQDYWSSTKLTVATPESWNDGSISARIWKGQFANEENAYLFVIDSKGTVSNGVPVSFSGGVVPECSLTSASWSTTTADEGTQVTLTVNGNNCDGKQLDFELFDTDDFLLFTDLDPVTATNPSSTTFNAGVATQTWITEWVDDTDGSDSDPEYVFVASLNEDPANNMQSSNTLKVSQVIVVPGEPHVGSVSNLGVLSHGESFSIDGSSFGVKSPVNPMSWDDFESHSLGSYIHESEPIYGPTWGGFDNYAGPGLQYDGTHTHAGSVAANVDWSYRDTNTAFGWVGEGPLDALYITYWRWAEGDYSNDIDVCHTGGGEACNLKQFYIFGTNSNLPQGMILIPAGATKWAWYNNDGDTEYVDQHWVHDDTYRVYNRWSVYTEMRTPVTEPNDIVKMWLDGQLGLDLINYPQRSCGDCSYDDFRLGYMAAGFTDTAKAWFDDLYIDTTQARIELCDLNDWNLVEVNGAHCEIQIPHTTWDGSNIQFTANQGSFTETDDLYLFVIDENGNVNSNGYPVSFGAATGCTDGNTRSCGSNIGECSFGTETCSGGTWGSCVGGITPVTEECGNSLDDDCDGSSDEDCGCTLDIECEDSNSCTNDVCTLGACINTPNTNSCDDGIACTENDICSAGTCGPGVPNDLLCPDNANCLTKTCTITGCSYSDCSVEGTLVAHYPLDSDYNDIAGSYNGVCTSCPTQTTGQLNNGYDFTLNSLDLGDVPVNDEITITAWVNPDFVNSCGPRIVSKASGTQTADHNWMMGLCDGQIRTRIKAGGTTDTLVGGTISETEDFVHLAVSYDGTTIRIYKDGTEVASQAHSVGGNLDLGTGVDTLIGFNTGGDSGDYFDGIIDDVRIYESALSAIDIQAVMIDGEITTTPTCTDLDSDTYSVEGGDCGEIDCNDGNAAINPGASDNNCNGVDEDCSGVSDQGYVSVSTSCGVGECSNSGSTSCSVGSIVDSCTAGSPITEVCNGLDDDCDTLIDEELDCGTSISQTINLNSGWN